MISKQTSGRGKLVIALAVTLVLAATFGTAVFFGIIGLEHYSGYFAPVWDPDGRRVYLLKRETRGLVWGLGWEHFTPPAYSYVLADRLSLQRLDTRTGDVEPLESFESSPVRGRVTKHYRGRIFNHLSARLVPGDGGVEILAVMNVPRVPSAEQWSLKGIWAEGRPSQAQWRQEWGGNTAAPESVLQKSIELLTVPGVEAFPAAVLAVRIFGDYEVLLQNRHYAALYPDGVPEKLIEERSRRLPILRARSQRETRAKLVARFRAEGASEGDAILRSIAWMEDHGLLPKSPRIVATRVESPPDDLRVFEINEEHFRVGLFQDIGSALATPGLEVETGTGTYLAYGEDDLGPRLRAWRDEGNDRFVVRSEGKLFLLEVRRFE